jgi:hypothetical protein
MKHHVWCNLQNVHKETDAIACPMCKDLKNTYPEIKGDSKGSALGKRHFPNAIPAS